jgi:hypothetical protein
MSMSEMSDFIPGEPAPHLPDFGSVDCMSAAKGRGAGYRREALLPTFLIIGAMKAATTSLHYYLSLHPEIFMSKWKELRFFVAPRNWDRGVDWYRSHFVTGKRQRGEASPQYSNFPIFSGVPERMHSVVPGARLIYVVRDPLERLVSHYMHEVCAGRESKDFQSAVFESPSNRYIFRSSYYCQIEQYLPRYPLSRILILTSEELQANRNDALRKVFNFLEVDQSFTHPGFREVRHRSVNRRKPTALGGVVEACLRRAGLGLLPPELRARVRYCLLRPFSNAIARPELSEAIRERLAETLHPDVENLRRLTGLRFESWSL